MNLGCMFSWVLTLNFPVLHNWMTFLCFLCFLKCWLWICPVLIIEWHTCALVVLNILWLLCAMQGLTVKEMEELHEDIKMHLDLDRSTPTHVQYWEVIPLFLSPVLSLLGRGFIEMYAPLLVLHWYSIAFVTLLWILALLYPKIMLIF